jgi:hypothetical protein
MPTVVATTPRSRPATTQLNFRQMQGEVQRWNVNAPPQMVQRWLQNSYRRVIDYRNWYGLLEKGQVVSPQAYTTGTVALTHGATAVVGTNTSWTSDMIGRQFRVGFAYPIYTVVVPPPSDAPMDATHLSLDIPWGGPNSATSGYQIFQNIYTLGDNVKFLLAMVNQQQGFRMKVNLSHPDVLNAYDAWRTQTGWTYLVSSAAPSSDGQVLYELYPAPTFMQAFPYLVYTQPDDFAADEDFPAVFIRSDVIVLGALPDAMRFQPRNNPGFDVQTCLKLADDFERKHLVELEKTSQADNNAFQKDLIWEFGRYPLTTYGADFAQSHDVTMGYDALN